MRDIYDIVKTDIFNSINSNVKVLSVDAVANGTQKVYLCSNKWLRVGDIITDITNHTFEVLTIANDYIIIKITNVNNKLSKGENVSIKAPKFLFGTHTSANNEYMMYSNDNVNRLPLIWLVEAISIEEYGLMSSLEQKPSLKFYFLDENNPVEYLNEDYRLNVVSPMIALKDELIRVIQENKYFGLIERWKTRTITRFGNENEKGVFENILNDNLSGVELVIDIPIFKPSKKCKC